MGLTQKAPLHPAEFSPEVLDLIGPILVGRGVKRVHDPFAGRGVRLARLCDELGIAFSGTDIERYPGSDLRVQLGDSSKWWEYPAYMRDWAVVTSPVYLNRISTDYVNGPTPNTKTNGRRAYGISLGRALDRANLARTCRQEAKYYEEHAKCVKWWGNLAIVNVDLPMMSGWRAVLWLCGFEVEQIIKAPTRRYRGPANSDKRAEHEIIIVATK